MGSKRIGLVALLPADAKFLQASIKASNAALSSILRAFSKPAPPTVFHLPTPFGRIQLSFPLRINLRKIS